MKKILSIVLTAAILVCAAVIPAGAANAEKLSQKLSQALESADDGQKFEVVVYALWKMPSDSIAREAAEKETGVKWMNFSNAEERGTFLDAYSRIKLENKKAAVAEAMKKMDLSFDDVSAEAFYDPESPADVPTDFILNKEQILKVSDVEEVVSVQLYEETAPAQAEPANKPKISAALAAEIAEGCKDTFDIWFEYKPNRKSKDELRKEASELTGITPSRKIITEQEKADYSTYTLALRKLTSQDIDKSGEEARAKICEALALDSTAKFSNRQQLTAAQINALTALDVIAGIDVFNGQDFDSDDSNAVPPAEKDIYEIANNDKDFVCTFDWPVDTLVWLYEKSFKTDERDIDMVRCLYLHELPFENPDSEFTSNVDWILYFGYTDELPPPMSSYALVGNRVVYGDWLMKPYSTGYGIYDVMEKKFVDIAQADGKYEDLEQVLKTLKIGKLIGDMNNDDELTISDATFMQKCVAEIESFDVSDEIDAVPQNEELSYYSDFNRDGVRDINDATAIQQYLAGK